jgi:organic radical activating enzyme
MPHLPNLQKPQPRVIDDGKTLLVHSLFDTIQGEGPFVGSPAFFVRLAGCNLQCPRCDTDYTSNVDKMEVVSLAAYVRNSTTSDLVVITGGEPFRQNILPLCAVLIKQHSLHVQIETNGRLLPQDMPLLRRLLRSGNLTIVVSPKTSTLNEDLARMAACYKYVVRDGEIAPDGLPNTGVLGYQTVTRSKVARPPEGYMGVVYVQPEDSGDLVLNTANMRAAAFAVQHSNRTYNLRLGCQLHKIAGKE